MKLSDFYLLAAIIVSSHLAPDWMLVTLSCIWLVLSVLAMYLERKERKVREELHDRLVSSILNLKK